MLYRTMILAAVLVCGCGDSRRDAFIQSKCGQLAVSDAAYNQCQKAMGKAYDSVNK